MARTTNPLTHLHRADHDYVLDWEVVDAPAPRAPEERDPLRALRQAFDTDEF